jgi:hypothetical protein
MTKAEADVELGGLTALAKAKAGMVSNECVQCAVLLFGGNGYTRTGQGELAERIGMVRGHPFATPTPPHHPPPPHTPSHVASHTNLVCRYISYCVKFIHN